MDYKAKSRRYASKFLSSVDRLLAAAEDTRSERERLRQLRETEHDAEKRAYAELAHAAARLREVQKARTEVASHSANAAKRELGFGTVNQTAKIFGVTRREVFRRAKTGEWSSWVIGGRRIYDLDEIVREFCDGESEPDESDKPEAEGE